MQQSSERLYEFGPFRVDALKRTLLREGEPVAVTSKVFETLLVLVERSGEVVQKEELIKRLWPDTIVEENNLTQHISMLRKILGERAGEHRFVVTVPGRGYSFVAEVRQIHTNGTARDNGHHAATEKSSGANGDLAVEESALEEQPVEHSTLEAFDTRAQPRRRMKRWLFILSLLAALVVSLGLYRWLGRSNGNQEDANVPVRSIAVLPFRSLGTEANDEYLGTGMTDTLIAKLSNIRQINVRPTSAVMRYAGEQRDAVAMGRELGVDAVLEGTLQRAGDRVRVTVQLVSVAGAKPIWAESFDEKFTDIFTMQDQISEQVARSILVKLSGEEQKQLRKRETANVEAYQAYAQGRYFWNKRSEEGLVKSIEDFQRAIELDASYALAYAGLADAYTVMAFYNLGPLSVNEKFERAKAATTRALELDDTLAEAHTSLASIKANYEYDQEGAEREFLRAIELNPNYATAHHWYSDLLAMMERFDEAMTEIKRAQELDPISPVINTTLAERLYFARRYTEAIAQLRRTLEMDQNFMSARFMLGLAYEQTGMYKEAVAELQRASELNNSTMIKASLAHARAMSGNKAEARRAMAELREASKSIKVSPFDIAIIYAGLGEKEQALEWLGKLDNKKKARWLLNTDPRLDALRSDPRFQELLRSLA